MLMDLNGLKIPALGPTESLQASILQAWQGWLAGRPGKNATGLKMPAVGPIESLQT